MSDAVVTHDVFFSHSAKDKAVVRSVAERLRADGLKVWLNEWEIPVAASRQSAAFSPESQEQEDGGALPRRCYAEKIEEGLEHSRLTFQPSAFILQPFLDAPIKGSLAQFLCINWRPADREQECANLLNACHRHRDRLKMVRDAAMLPKQMNHADHDNASFVDQLNAGPKEVALQKATRPYSPRIAAQCNDAKSIDAAL